jgi:DNA-directed RNA polymerase specialized sigma24 family protein
VPPEGLNDVDWGEVFAAALAIALRFVPKQDARDAVLEGIRKVIDGSVAWNAASGRSLPAFVVTVGYNERRNRRRKEKRRRQPELAERIADATTGMAPATPEDEVSEAEEQEASERLFREVEGESQDDPDALTLLDCARQGLSELSEQVEHTGWTVERVRNARKRIKRRMQALMMRNEEEEERS